MRGVERALAGLEEGRLPAVDKPKSGPVADSMIDQARRRLKARAEELAANEPVVPTMPKLFFSDTTIEGLAVKMQRGLPIGALWEDEGGVTLGSVGLKEDRLLGFVTSFSKLWDATGWTQDRGGRNGVVVTRQEA